MKILYFNNQQFKADKIIKNNTDIIGQDLKCIELFAFKGISDFTQFIVTNEDGTSASFDMPQPTIADLQAQIFDLTSQLVNGGTL